MATLEPQPREFDYQGQYVVDEVDAPVPFDGLHLTPWAQAAVGTRTSEALTFQSPVADLYQRRYADADPYVTGSTGQAGYDWRRGVIAVDVATVRPSSGPTLPAPPSPNAVAQFTGYAPGQTPEPESVSDWVLTSGASIATSTVTNDGGGGDFPLSATVWLAAATGDQGPTRAAWSGAARSSMGHSTDRQNGSSAPDEPLVLALSGPPAWIGLHLDVLGATEPPIIPSNAGGYYGAQPWDRRWVATVSPVLRGTVTWPDYQWVTDVPPPLRQVQRDDGLAGSALRVRGASSRQRSVRAGGYL